MVSSARLRASSVVVAARARASSASSRARVATSATPATMARRVGAREGPRATRGVAAARVGVAIGAI
jgi:hypothetical protein